MAPGPVEGRGIEERWAGLTTMSPTVMSSWWPLCVGCPSLPSASWVSRGAHLLLPGPWGHTRPGAVSVQSRAVGAPEPAVQPLAWLQAGARPACRLLGGSPRPARVGAGCMYPHCHGCHAASGASGGQAPPRGVRMGVPCSPRPLPESSLCVREPRLPHPSIRPLSALMCPLHSTLRLHVEEFSLDSSVSQ